MERYKVTGMNCAACQSRVENAVSKVPGVSSCAVSLLTNSMGVEGIADSSDIIKAVQAAGYDATLKDTGETKPKTDDSALEDKDTPKLKRRLIISLILLIPLMYVSMGHMMWDFPLPGFLAGNHIAMGLYEMLLSGIIMVINQKFFINGFRGLVHRAPNMDTLVALGSSASFIYSVYALFAMTVANNNGQQELVMQYMEEFYFESAAMILVLITIGKTLEARSKGKTTDALKSLMKLTPQTAVVIRNNEEKVIQVSEMKAGDRFVIKPGASIPVDGIIIKGFSSVNESAFTGESVPVDKNTGDHIFAGTINIDGHLTCEAQKIGEDTSLSKVIQMVSDAAATKAPIAKIADKVSGIFVPTVIGIAIVTFIVWMMTGQTFGYSLARAISVLVISCPCALGLATPVAIMVGNGIGARNGILFKNSVALEQTGKVQIVALDKTGTITTGDMQVTDIFVTEETEEEKLLKTALSLEIKSEHPIAKAIVSMAKTYNIDAENVMDFKAVAGNGLSGIINGENCYGGSENYIKNILKTEDPLLKEQSLKASKEGKTPVYFATGKTLLGMIAISDTVKPESEKAIKELKNMGLSVVMLTGDNEITAASIAQRVGVEEVISKVKPEGKEKVISLLKKCGKVAMVGDGINDAPALTCADIGIAIGAGTDVAIDAASIVLSKSSIMDVAAAIRISRATIKNIHENLFWAFFYNVLGIPLAAGCFVAAFGWSLNPMFGAAAMSLSSVFVVTNALRLNLLKVYDAAKDRKIDKPKIDYEMIKIKTEEKTAMKITVKGMMCKHCEAHVKEALEAIDGIEEAVANHDENLVTITNSKDIPESLIKETVEKAGYEYLGIQ